MNVSPHHLNLFTSVHSALTRLKEDIPEESVLKSCSFTFTVMVKENDGGWKIHELEIPLLKKEYVPMVLPRKNKDMELFIQKANIERFAHVREVSDLEDIFEFTAGLLNRYKPGSKMHNHYCERFREFNNKWVFNVNESTIVDKGLAAFMLKFNDWTDERMSLSAKMRVILVEKANTFKETIHEKSVDLKEECVVCKGWRTTAGKIDACNACIVTIPTNLPITGKTSAATSSNDTDTSKLC